MTRHWIHFFFGINEKVRKRVVESLKKQMEMRKVEGGELGSEAWVGSNLDDHWYSVESGQLFAAAGANKRIGKDLAA